MYGIFMVNHRQTAIWDNICFLFPSFSIMQIQNVGIYIHSYIILGFYQDIPPKPMINAALRVITTTNEGCELLLMALKILNHLQHPVGPPPYLEVHLRIGG